MSLTDNLAIVDVWAGSAELAIPEVRGEDMHSLAPLRIGRGYRLGMSYSVTDLRILKNYVDNTDALVYDHDASWRLDGPAKADLATSSRHFTPSTPECLRTGCISSFMSTRAERVHRRQAFPTASLHSDPHRALRGL